MEGYATIKDIAARWDLTERRVQKMCEDGILAGAAKFGTVWAIPDTTERPQDGRIKSGKYRNWRKKKEDQLRRNKQNTDIIFYVKPV